MSAYVPFVILCAVLWLTAIAVIFVADVHERAHTDRLRLLALEACDWGEPTRAQVEWIFDAPTLADAPIFDAMYRERFEADALAEIERLTGGA